MKSLTIALLALLFIAFIATINADDSLCEDQVVRFGRDPEDCTRHFVCFLSRIIWFQCPEGRVYVEEMRECIYGDTETCIAEV